MDNLELAFKVDLKQFLANLKTMEGVSAEAAAKVQQIFSVVKPIKNPIDPKPIKEGFDKISSSAMTLNYIIRDSPYFFQRFDMGIMAVTNNINPFIDQMLMAKQQLGSWKAAFSSFGSTLMGVGGISVAFSLVVAAIQAYSFEAAKSEGEQTKMRKTVQQLADEYKSLNDRITDLKKEVNNLDIKDFESALRGLRTEANKLNKELEDSYSLAMQLQGSGFGALIASVLGASPEALAKAQLNSMQVNESLKEMSNLGINLNTLQFAYKKGMFGDTVKQFTKNELTDMKDKLDDIADSTLPNLTKELNLNGVGFSITGAEAKKLADEIDKLYSKQKEKKAEKLITSDIELRKEIAEIDNKLKAGNISVNEQLRLVGLRIDKQKELNSLTATMLDILDEIKNRHPEIFTHDENNLYDKKGKLKNKFVMKPIDNIPKLGTVTESTNELQRML